MYRVLNSNKFILTHSYTLGNIAHWRQTYTPWCKVLLEKLTGLQLVKKFPAFHGTRRFITALTSVRHLSLSWASPVQSVYPHPTSWRSILILTTHQRLSLPSGLFPSGFPTKTLYTLSLLTHTRHMPSPSHEDKLINYKNKATFSSKIKKIHNNQLHERITRSLIVLIILRNFYSVLLRNCVQRKRVTRRHFT